MARFNLLYEPWIKVMVDRKGNTESVSLIEVFENAHNYIGLAGDTKTQDFAVLRVLLAVLHTVFSRFNADGDEHGYFELDERYRQLEEVDYDDEDDYLDDLYDTWLNLWEAGEFPVIVKDYLEKWEDRFYLFDDEYPFFQVTKEITEEFNPNFFKANSTTGRVYGKQINRQLSESSNKIALFAPKTTDYKEIMSEEEIARWLITYQGYTGTADKQAYKHKDNSIKHSKGWIYDIGGIYLSGDNLYETFILNLALVHPEDEYQAKSQKPCWEYSLQELIDKYLSYKPIDNIAELYTVWSRQIYIDSETDVNEPFELIPVKLPEVDHQDQFLELMTIYRYNDTGVNKDSYTPVKHRVNRSMWRSFGLITLPNSKENNQRQPGIMTWLNDISKEIPDFSMTINSVSMIDDGNATSWVPVDEAVDSLKMSDEVLTDVTESGWIPRINATIDETKMIINRTYRSFMNDIKEIRNIESSGFVNAKVEEMFFLIDEPFRLWLQSIDAADSMEDKTNEWKNILLKLVRQTADKILESAGNRDYLGVSVGDDKTRVKNIATAYNNFISRLYSKKG